MSTEHVYKAGNPLSPPARTPRAHNLIVSSFVWLVGVFDVPSVCAFALLCLPNSLSCPVVHATSRETVCLCCNFTTRYGDLGPTTPGGKWFCVFYLLVVTASEPHIMNHTLCCLLLHAVVVACRCTLCCLLLHAVVIVGTIMPLHMTSLYDCFMIAFSGHRGQPRVLLCGLGHKGRRGQPNRQERY